MSTNRKDKRAALLTLLETLTIPQLVSDDLPETFVGKHPIVFLRSRGSAEVPVTYGAGQVSESLYFEIHALALYKDPNATPALTVEDSGDTLDDMDAELRDLIGNNLHTDDWQMLIQEGASQVQQQVREIEGRSFKEEVRILKVMP